LTIDFFVRMREICGRMKKCLVASFLLEIKLIANYFTTEAPPVLIDIRLAAIIR